MAAFQTTSSSSSATTPGDVRDLHCCFSPLLTSRTNLHVSGSPEMSNDGIMFVLSSVGRVVPGLKLSVRGGSLNGVRYRRRGPGCAKPRRSQCRDIGEERRQNRPARAAVTRRAHGGCGNRLRRSSSPMSLHRLLVAPCRFLASPMSAPHSDFHHGLIGPARRRLR